MCKQWEIVYDLMYFLKNITIYKNDPLNIHTLTIILFTTIFSASTADQDDMTK